MVYNFCFSNSVYNKANIFLGLIKYELNSLLGASHLVVYISVHIRFDLERYLLNMSNFAKKCNGFHSYPKVKNMNCPEQWIPFVFLKRNSFKKVVTTK